MTRGCRGERHRLTDCEPASVVCLPLWPDLPECVLHSFIPRFKHRSNSRYLIEEEEEEERLPFVYHARLGGVPFPRDSMPFNRGIKVPDISIVRRHPFVSASDKRSALGTTGGGRGEAWMLIDGVFVLFPRWYEV